MGLEDLLIVKGMSNSIHDRIVKDVKKFNELNPNIVSVVCCGYYKNKKVEGEIDLLQMWFNSNVVKNVSSYKDVPFEKAILLLYEVKSVDSLRNYNKALYQLKKSKDFILNNSFYERINSFYVFGTNQGTGWRIESV
jgi:hypothetical protein